jgi:hypothetical protein
MVNELTFCAVRLGHRGQRRQSDEGTAASAAGARQGASCRRPCSDGHRRQCGGRRRETRRPPRSSPWRERSASPSRHAATPQRIWHERGASTGRCQFSKSTSIPVIEQKRDRDGTCRTRLQSRSFSLAASKTQLARHLARAVWAGLPTVPQVNFPASGVGPSKAGSRRRTKISSVSASATKSLRAPSAVSSPSRKSAPVR